MISPEEILNASILIVDDQESNVRLLEQMLREAGYLSITSTTDPYAVSELYRTHQYDLILLDLQMPGMDGFQVMEALREIETESYVPILVVTAQPAHKLQALACGANDFISKPFDLIEVKTRIHNMLEVRLLYKRLGNYNKQLEQTVQERTAELQESETRFRRLSELASDWYWEQDENGKFTKTHGPVQEMLGIQVESLMGENGERASHWNEAERAVLEANMAARRPFLDFIYSRVEADGAHQYFQVSGEPIFDATGRFTGYRGVGRDVTEVMRDIARPYAV